MDASYLVRQCFVYNCNLLILFAASGAIGPLVSDAKGLRFESVKDYIFYSLREKRRHLPTTRDITEIFGMFHLFLACTTRVYFVTQNSY